MCQREKFNVPQPDSRNCKVNSWQKMQHENQTARYYTRPISTTYKEALQWSGLHTAMKCTENIGSHREEQTWIIPLFK